MVELSKYERSVLRYALKCAANPAFLPPTHWMTPKMRKAVTVLWDKFDLDAA
jgi:hypothetical protein